jgi:NAD(P)-dependent dehydrogenase (short-subunit alcohol dehydrogenase family)
LDSKVAIVTGAGRGIGRGIARLLASEGASVVVNDVGAEIDGTGADRSFADQVVEEIAESGGRAVSSYESVTSRGAGESIVNKAIESFGRLDIVVTAAGILRDRMIFNMSEQEWDDVIAVHLKGTFSLVRSAASIFREQQSGRIVTFSSVSGLVGQSGQSNYGAAKDGIAGFTRVVAKEMSRYGVTVNSISPGAATRMTQSVPDTTRQLQQKKLRGISSPAPPVGVLSNEPEDVAPMVVWLASDAADRVTGRIFYCSGNIVSEVGHPVPVRTIYKDGRWTPEELAGAISTTTDIDLVNPAPRQPPS